MSDDVRMGGFNILPPVVKNLLILNCLFFLAKIVLLKFGIDLDTWLGLHYFVASDFHIWQPVTYMFMHGDFSHLFFNMFALWMFGATVENYWGSRRFLIYYMVTGLGAGCVHYLVMAFTIQPEIALMDTFLANPCADTLQNLLQNHQFHLEQNSSELAALNESLRQLSVGTDQTQVLNLLVDQIAAYRIDFLNAHNVVGASGAVYALLLAFGMLFPNAHIYLYFLLPIKAKWFVAFYFVVELLDGVFATGDGVAHFAHVGGMLVGLVLILIWKNRERNRRQNDWMYYDNNID